MGKFELADKELFEVKICLRCGATNPIKADKCRRCGYSKFRKRKKGERK